MQQLKPQPMVEITNESTQGFEVFFTTEVGVTGYWLTPGKRLIVPKSYITSQVKTLQHRRILTIMDI